ncbi:Tat pathway signal sequence domain protein [Labilibacter sediminis]|nr:Tat pathway signal sequence domain protein [Labilibacter sediminis]
MHSILKIGLVAICFLFISCKQQSKDIVIDGQTINCKLITSDDFETDLSNWTVEQRPGGNVSINNSILDIDDASGCTVWYNLKLKGPLMIEYDVIVVDEGGVNDRVSDLNCFWMATDIHAPNDFFKRSALRAGKFQNYHDMQLYYVGLGGHDNTKTRFRRYTGGGERPCLPEHDLNDKKYLITGNHINKIRLIAYKNRIQYYRNDQLIFDVTDNNPYTEGYFGIRTYKNHMTVDNFKVYQLSNQ